MKIINVVGARPNFMKIAPIVEAISKYNEEHAVGHVRLIESILVHTGQHYDEKMSQSFFNDLGIPKPDIDLEVGSASHAVQTADIMKRFEPVLLKESPDYILVVGDVNSTIACALTASKLGIKIIHVEAGLRSFDRGMPEEINRVLTDALSDLLFTSERSAEQNLLREGVSKNRIFFVGNVMIDTLLKHREKARKSTVLDRLGLSKDDMKPGDARPAVPYAVLTLHRPSNVDDKRQLNGIMEAVSEVAERVPVVFPVHPRTKKRINDFGLDHLMSAGSSPGLKTRGIFEIEPLGYLDFLQLMLNAGLVLTDSGGMQEETTVLGVPCITLRENTERPITVTEGTNCIVGADKQKIITQSVKVFDNNNKVTSRIPELWDGRAAERIIDIVMQHGRTDL